MDEGFSIWITFKHWCTNDHLRDITSNQIVMLITMMTMISIRTKKRESIAKGMIELAERCPGLRSVCVSNCSHLTDQVLWLGSLNIIIRKWLNHSHNLHRIRNQNQIEILRASWPWPPTAPVWWHSSAPDSHISPMLAFRWDRPPHHYHHFLIVLCAVISIIELNSSLCIFGKDCYAFNLNYLVCVFVYLFVFVSIVWIAWVDPSCNDDVVSIQSWALCGAAMLCNEGKLK